MSTSRRFSDPAWTRLYQVSPPVRGAAAQPAFAAIAFSKHRWGKGLGPVIGRCHTISARDDREQACQYEELQPDTTERQESHHKKSRQRKERTKEHLENEQRDTGCDDEQKNRMDAMERSQAATLTPTSRGKPAIDRDGWNYPENRKEYRFRDPGADRTDTT